MGQEGKGSADGHEDSFLVTLDEGYRQVSVLLAQAFAREESWLDGVRGALAAMLGFLEAEPALAHILLVDVMVAGPRALECREHHIASLTSLVRERSGRSGSGQPHSLATAGVVASLLEEVARAILVERAPGGGLSLERGVVVPAALRDPRAHRARRAVRYLDGHPGASNREVADGIGVARHEQISKLLARLADIGLLSKHHPSRRGHANAWSLTPHGLEVARALQQEEHRVGLQDI